MMENMTKEKAEFMLRCLDAILTNDDEKLKEIEKEVFEDLKKRNAK